MIKLYIKFIPLSHADGWLMRLSHGGLLGGLGCFDLFPMRGIPLQCWSIPMSVRFWRTWNHRSNHRKALEFSWILKQRCCGKKRRSTYFLCLVLLAPHLKTRNHWRAWKVSGILLHASSSLPRFKGIDNHVNIFSVFFIWVFFSLVLVQRAEMLRG